MKIAVTGSYGFTGRHFVKEAYAQGYSVDCIETDLLDVGELQNELIASAPDFVVHLAAVSFVASEDVKSIYNTNVIGTLNLLQAIGQLKKIPTKILIASSANIYGNSDASPVSELQPSRVLNHYAASKAAMEQLISVYKQTLPIVVTRPFNYTGQGQSDVFLVPKLVDHFKRRALSIDLGNINVEREFNSIGFVVSSYIFLLRFAKSGETYNICTGKSYKIKKLIEILQSLTQHQILVKTLPSLVRSNELMALYGDPTKLIDLSEQSGFKLPVISLEETLSSMLDS